MQIVQSQYQVNCDQVTLRCRCSKIIYWYWKELTDELVRALTAVPVALVAIVSQIYFISKLAAK